MDRTNERLSSLYDELNPGVIRVLRPIASAVAAVAGRTQGFAASSPVGPWLLPCFYASATDT